MRTTRTISWIMRTVDRLLAAGSPTEALEALVESIGGLDGIEGVQIVPGPRLAAGPAGANEIPGSARDRVTVVPGGQFLTTVVAVSQPRRRISAAQREAIECAVLCAERRLVALGAEALKVERLAVAAHDMRAPLAPILASTRLLRHRGVDGVELERIERQANRLARLAESLLGEHGRPRSWGEVEVGATIVSAMELVLPLCSEKELDLRADCTADLRVMGDGESLVRVLTNLLLNAAKYTPRGGSIRIVARREGDDAVVEIADTGQGIPPEQICAIFVPRVRGHHTRAEPGHGLGLAIVRELVELHGGSVLASSPGLGHGAVFRVNVPLATAMSPRKLAVGPSARRIASDFRVLGAIVHVCLDVRSAGVVLESVPVREVGVLRSSTDVIRTLCASHPALALLLMEEPAAPYALPSAAVALAPRPQRQLAR
jgi:signal transduction histidine kinase